MKHKKITTEEHFEWDKDTKEWVPTHKTITDSEENDDDDGLGALRLNPWGPQPPYRPYWMDNPVSHGQHISLCRDSASDQKYGSLAVSWTD